MASTLSTLVVIRNNREFLGRCLESLPPGSEVVAVDNASTDGSAEFVAETFPHVRLIRSDRNLGFAGGINRAAREATGDYLLFLHADAEATPNAIARMRAFLDEHPTCGAACGRLLSMTEQWQRNLNLRRLPRYRSLAAHLLLLGYLWPDNPITRHARAADVDGTKPALVEQATAACLMVRRHAFEHVGGMDEQFTPAWFEEVDFCRRLLTAGWTIFFIPRAPFRHLGGVSMREFDRVAVQTLYYRNLERYMAKHHGLLARPVTRSLVVTGMALRTAGSLLSGDMRRVRMFGAVCREAIKGYPGAPRGSADA
ncbi:MAG TPA: glycosyltransferase family 2 protein [Vicinamibacterales bacterium]